MVAPPTALTDDEVRKLVQLIRDSQMDRDLTQEEHDWIVARTPRIRIRRWPPRIRPWDQLPPDVIIPFVIPANMMAQVSNLVNSQA